MIISLHCKQLSGLTVGKGFGYCELVLTAVDFYEIEFILLCTPLIFGYMSIAFVISLAPDGIKYYFSLLSEFSQFLFTGTQTLLAMVLNL